jgi:hypothetical protein
LASKPSREKKTGKESARASPSVGDKSRRSRTGSSARVRRGPSSGAAGEAYEDTIDLAQDAASAGFLPPDLEEEMEAGEREPLEEPPSEFAGGRRARDELETDGPVIGGAGMRRMGGDRAISSGTGGLAAGEDLDPVAEGDYWRENFRRSPYDAAETEDRYEPAYRFGWTRAGQYEYRNRGFEEVELELRRQWQSRDRDQPWEDARDAAYEAWRRARKKE